MFFVKIENTVKVQNFAQKLFFVENHDFVFKNQNDSKKIKFFFKMEILIQKINLDNNLFINFNFYKVKNKF